MRRLLVTLAVVLLSHPASATNLIVASLDSAPSSSANGGVYTGSVSTLVIHVQNGSPATMFEHITGAECYGGSGGCAKFYPSTTTTGSYRGFTLGSFSGGASQKNLNYVMKWNSTWRGADNLKGNYLTLGGSPFWTQEKAPAAAFGGFQLGLSYNGTLYYLHGNGQSSGDCTSNGYECCPHEAGCALGTGVAAAGPFTFPDYDGEWVRIELEMISTGVFRIYLWTTDLVYNGLYMAATTAPTGEPDIVGLGGAYFTDGGAASGSYTMVDDVCLADTFIGSAGCGAGGGGGSTKYRFRFRVADLAPISGVLACAFVPVLVATPRRKADTRRGRSA